MHFHAPLWKPLKFYYRICFLRYHQQCVPGPLYSLCTLFPHTTRNGPVSRYESTHEWSLFVIPVSSLAFRKCRSAWAPGPPMKRARDRAGWVELKRRGPGADHGRCCCGDSDGGLEPQVWACAALDARCVPLYRRWTFACTVQGWMDIWDSMYECVSGTGQSD